MNTRWSGHRPDEVTTSQEYHLRNVVYKYGEYPTVDFSFSHQQHKTSLYHKPIHFLHSHGRYHQDTYSTTNRMKLTTAFVATLFSVSALAAPAPAAEADAGVAVSMMVAAAPQWTIQNMKRVCGSGKCTWTFSINDHQSAAVPCKFVVKGSPATKTDSSGHVCGAYTVGTGWSGQFGANSGFTTLSVVNNNKKQIIYPSYTDKDLNPGKVVKPNRSYAPQSLP